MNSEVHDRAAQRRRLKQLRRAVSPAERRLASEAVAHHILRHFHLRPGLRIGVYAPLPSELDTGPLIRLARQHHCHIYLPRLTDLRRCRMQFIEASGPMRRNHLGIFEPIRIRALSVRRLDIVFVPLVGFDATGMRLGMGSGYYDRAFAFLHHRKVWAHPRFVGIAYALQQVPHIDGAPHDVRLNAVVTEKGVIRCTTGF